MTNCEGSYKLTVSSSGEMIDASGPDKSTENLVLDNRLALEPPDLIPKIGNLNRKSSSVQDVRDNRKKFECGRFGNDKYRLIPAGNGLGHAPGHRVGGMFGENIIRNECRATFALKDAYDGERVPVTTVECVRAVMTKPESQPPEEERQRKEPAEEGGEGETEKAPSLLRVRSNLEKRPLRPESLNGDEAKVERSKSLKLVERSTSFGRTDTMRVVEVTEAPEGPDPDLSVSDASSQTDLPEEEPVRDEAARRKLEEELECERLSRDLASQLSPSDKLQSLLVPDSERKKPTDYVAGLFCLEVSLKPRRQPAAQKEVSEPREAPSGEGVVVVNGVASNQSETVVETSSSSDGRTAKSGETPSDSRRVQQKKEELMTRLGRKLAALKEERDALTTESAVNEELGASVADSVAKTARPHELAKYRLHVEEVGKITSLLLGLSGRLAKAENVLSGLPSRHDDRKLHESKRDKLREQLAEAKQLKENIDRRSDSVAKTLGKYLNAEEYADYVHFIRMKAKLIVDLREVAEKISFGEEQLAALKETSSS